jgi:MarR family transcriptional regulator, temperature-dependent positive regulator of motility
MSTPVRRKEALPPITDGLEIYGMPGHLIRRMHQVSVALFDARTRSAGSGLTPVQFGALVAIEAHPGLDQATLASAIAYDRVTIGGVIDRLESKGFVRREIAKDDRRSRRLHLQPQGRAALAAIRPHVALVQQCILQGLSAKEQETFLLLLQKAVDSVGDLSRAPLKPVPR